jgi:hypothetical protein
MDPFNSAPQHCSARSAQDKEGQHRPVIASIIHSLGVTNGPLKKLAL